MTGAKLQALVIKELKRRKFLVVNVMTASVNGCADLLACSPTGRFYALEIKGDGDTLKPLQRYFLHEVKKRGGVAMVITDLKQLEKQLREL